MLAQAKTTEAEDNAARWIECQIGCSLFTANFLNAAEKAKTSQLSLTIAHLESKGSIKDIYFNKCGEHFLSFLCLHRLTTRLFLVADTIVYFARKDLAL